MNYNDKFQSAYWTHHFSVGHELLDSQHKRLHELCQQAIAQIDNDSPEGVELFHSMLNDLVCFATEHFNTEESLLSSLNYPSLEEHKRQHDEYKDRLTELLYLTVIGQAGKPELLILLKDWWEQHTMNDDKKYMEFILSADL